MDWHKLLQQLKDEVKRTFLIYIKICAFGFGVAILGLIATGFMKTSSIDDKLTADPPWVSTFR
jgi:hypothetical protein